MYKRHNPFEGMEPKEIADKIYNNISDNYYDDYLSLVKFLGNMENVDNVEEIEKDDYKEIENKNNTSNYYRVTVMDFDKTGFKNSEALLRSFGIYADVFRINRKIYIETSGPMDTFSKAWVDYFNNIHQQNVELASENHGE